MSPAPSCNGGFSLPILALSVALFAVPCARHTRQGRSETLACGQMLYKPILPLLMQCAAAGWSRAQSCSALRAVVGNVVFASIGLSLTREALFAPSAARIVR